MAKNKSKSKSKPKAKAKAKAPARKKAVRKAKEPKPSNPWIFNMMRPMADPQTVIDYGKAVEEGKTPNPNTGRMTRDAYMKAFEAYNQAMEKGQVPPSIPPIYEPTMVAHAAATNARVAIAGQASLHKNKPAAWDDKVLGPWRAGMYILDGKTTSTSIRRCHLPDARKLVENREENVLTIGSHDFVVGTGVGDDNVPAAMLINASKTGNYGCNERGGKREGFASNMKELAALVGRFSNGWQIVTIDDKTRPGARYVACPHMHIDK